MPLILHLSDLHLVAPADSSAINDHKAGLVPRGKRLTHHQVLRFTLERVRDRLIEEQRSLDAIIMSGDIADRCNPGGFEAFLDLLDALNPILPTPDRIVVVPGNHDVAYGLAPDDPMRYVHFTKVIRGAGFVTPLLEGIDEPGTLDANKHIIRFDDLEILPINSSGFSQVRMDIGLSEEQWEKIEAALDKDVKAIGALQRLRVADAARVSEHDLEALHSLLDGSGTRKRREPFEPHRRSIYPTPLRIAVLHHQLLPVTLAEEVKAFESLTNLGLLRQFFAEHGIAIVLHGHKHAPFTYLDSVVSGHNSKSCNWLRSMALSGV